MKVFTKNITRCRECPNVSYIHYDGEGESVPYEYDCPVCSIVKVPRVIRIAHNQTRTVQESRNIPDKNNIPNWCPL